MNQQRRDRIDTTEKAAQAFMGSQMLMEGITMLQPFMDVYIDCSFRDTTMQFVRSLIADAREDITPDNEYMYAILQVENQFIPCFCSMHDDFEGDELAADDFA